MIPSYDLPLSAESRWELFYAWCAENAKLLDCIENHAIDMWKAGHKRISTQYLVEWARYEMHMESKGVPFIDNNGKVRFYRINNTDCAALGRLLKERHPDMPIELRKSILDGAA